MKQFKKLTNSILAFTLCLSMVLPMVPAVQADAASTTNPSVANQPAVIADLTPPVVENLVFDQNNQIIPANNKTISFTFDAYDSDGSALSLDHTVAWIYVPNNMHYDEYGRDLKADTINSVTDPVTEITTYTVTFNLDSDWEGPMEVRELRIGDVYGNAVKFDFYDKDSNTSSMNATIDIPVNNAISVTDIDVDAANAHTPPDVANPNVNVSSHVNFNNVDNVWEVSLTDTVTAVLIPMEVTVAPTANFQQGDEIKLFFRRSSDNREEQITLFYEANIQKFRGSLDVNFYRGTETFELKSIKYNGETIPCNIPFSYVAVHNNTDKVAPVLKDLYFATVDGNNNLVPLTNGFIAKRADTVKLVADIYDVTKVDNADAFLKSSMYGLNEDWVQIDLEYDANWGLYVADIPLAPTTANSKVLYATEWYIEQVYLNDIFDNISRTEEAEVSLGKNLSSLYFIVQENDGTTSVPARNVTVQIDTVNGSQEYRVENLQRVTTFGEILDKRPDDMQMVNPNVDGAQLTGWYWRERDQYIQLNDTIFIDTYEHLNFVPVYDKACVRVWSSYADKNRNFQWGDDIYFGTYGTDSVQDILDQVTINGTSYSQVTHSTEMDFQKWIYEGAFQSLQDKLTPQMVAIDVKPDYKKVQVEYSFQYMNEKGAWERDWQVELFNKGITYQDAIDEFAKKNFNHDKAAQFDQWILVNANYFWDLNAVISYRDTFEFVAEYQNPKVPVMIGWYDENGELQNYYQEVVCSKTTTWQDLVDLVQNDLNAIKHSSAYGFVNWNIGVPENAPLSSVISPKDAGNGLYISAQYQKYPHTYWYAYLTDADEVKMVMETKLEPAGTKIMDYYDQVESALQLDQTVKQNMDGWLYNNRFGMEEEVSLNTTNTFLAMDYTDISPTFVVFNTVNKDKMPETQWLVSYTQAGHMDPSYTAELLAGVQKQDTWTTSSLTFEEYVMWAGENIGGDAAPIAHVKAVFEEAVLILVYPDETYEIKVVKDGSTYKLPKKYHGKDVEWEVSDVDFWDIVQGNTHITVNTPYMIASAIELQGSGNGNSGNSGNHGNSSNNGNSGNNGNQNNGNQNNGSSVPVVYPAPVQTTTPSTSVTPSTQTTATAASAVVLEQTVINDAKTDIANAQTGDVITVDMATSSGETATVVPATLLEEAKGKDVTIVLDMGGYTWEINGMDIHAPSLKDINLEVTLDTNAVAPAVVNTVANGAPTRQISLTHNGDFGFKGKLSINVGDQYAGQFGNLYYYDSNEKLVFQNAGIIDGDGNVSLEFAHASDYVVVVSEEVHEAAEVENTEAAKETEAVVEDAEAEDAVAEEVQEEAGLPIFPIIIVAVAVILVVAFVATRRKNDEE